MALFALLISIFIVVFAAAKKFLANSEAPRSKILPRIWPISALNREEVGKEEVAVEVWQENNEEEHVNQQQEESRDVVDDKKMLLNVNKGSFSEGFGEGEGSRCSVSDEGIGKDGDGEDELAIEGVVDNSELPGSRRPCSGASVKAEDLTAA